MKNNTASSGTKTRSRNTPAAAANNTSGGGTTGARSRKQTNTQATGGQPNGGGAVAYDQAAPKARNARITMLKKSLTQSTKVGASLQQALEWQNAQIAQFNHELEELTNAKQLQAA